VGFALSPLDYWSSHFWYYSGCRSISTDVAAPGWVECHGPLMTLRYHNSSGKEKACVIQSPTDGLVVRTKVRFRTMPNIGYGYENAHANREFIVVRPWRHHVSGEGKPFDPVSWYNTFSFDPLTEAIYDAVTGDSVLSGLLNLAFDQGFRKFDPKHFFKTKEELLKAADELRHVYAIWLPDWDFSSDSYEFGE
jgi:hypothetical protein